MLVHVSVAIETEAGHPGRLGDSAARPAGRALSCASVRATTRRLDTVAGCALGRAGTNGENQQKKQNCK